jgi:hypothetical protein
MERSEILKTASATRQRCLGLSPTLKAGYGSPGPLSIMQASRGCARKGAIVLASYQSHAMRLCPHPLYLPK